MLDEALEERRTMQAHQYMMRPVAALPATPLFHTDWFVPDLPPATLEMQGEGSLLHDPGYMDLPGPLEGPDEIGEWSNGELDEQGEASTALPGKEQLLRELFRGELKAELASAFKVDGTGPETDDVFFLSPAFAELLLGPASGVGGDSSDSVAAPTAHEFELLCDPCSVDGEHAREPDARWLAAARADEQDLAESDQGMLQQRLSAAVEALRGSCCLCDESLELSEQAWAAQHVAGAPTYSAATAQDPPPSANACLRLQHAVQHAVPHDGRAAVDLLTRLRGRDSELPVSQPTLQLLAAARICAAMHSG